MSKRKFKKGPRVDSVAELLEHDWFIVDFGPKTAKTVHTGFLRSWQLQTCEKFIDAERIYIAVRLTNEEYYAGKTDSQLAEMLDEDICNYCPLPEELKGVHCYGGEPVMCEGRCCKEALEAWKEEYVE